MYIYLYLYIYIYISIYISIYIYIYIYIQKGALAGRNPLQSLQPTYTPPAARRSRVEHAPLKIFDQLQLLLLLLLLRTSDPKKETKMTKHAPLTPHASDTFAREHAAAVSPQTGRL